MQRVSPTVRQVPILRVSCLPAATALQPRVLVFATIFSSTIMETNRVGIAWIAQGSNHGQGQCAALELTDKPTNQSGGLDKTVGAMCRANTMRPRSRPGVFQKEIQTNQQRERANKNPCSWRPLRIPGLSSCESRARSPWTLIRISNQQSHTPLSPPPSSALLPFAHKQRQVCSLHETS